MSVAAPARAIELESPHSTHAFDAVTALTNQLSTETELWLQLPLNNAERGYSTRGSSIDAELLWVAKCGDAPTVAQICVWWGVPTELLPGFDVATFQRVGREVLRTRIQPSLDRRWHPKSKKPPAADAGVA